jgi:hypothetical protein
MNSILAGNPLGLGPPTSYFHSVWHGAAGEYPTEFFYELDKERWAIRVVEKFSNGSVKALSFADQNWRDLMPEAAIPPIEEINERPEFSAREISRAEFEVIWTAAIS